MFCNCRLYQSIDFVNSLVARLASLCLHIYSGVKQKVTVCRLNNRASLSSFHTFVGAKSNFRNRSVVALSTQVSSVKPWLHERFFACAGDAIFSNFVTSPARDENCTCSHPRTGDATGEKIARKKLPELKFLQQNRRDSCLCSHPKSL